MIDKGLLSKISLPPQWSLEVKEEDLYLHTGEGRPFTLDFSKLKNLSKNQPLAKAVGVKSGKRLRVLDVTAGWGKDAFLLASLSCDVIAIESHPLVFIFLKAALSKRDLKTPKSLQFILDNSLNYLKNMKSEEKPEVIYMDPMFASDKKSLSHKPLRVLKTLVGESNQSETFQSETFQSETFQSETLFKQALGKSLNRIVVKRHKHQKSMPFAPLMCTFSGRSVCYDVFSTQRKKGQTLC